LPDRLARLRALMGGGDPVAAADEPALWAAAREFAWVPAGWSLVKVPLTPAGLPVLGGLAVLGLRRYGAGGQVAWVALPDGLPSLDTALAARGLAGLVIFGPPGSPRIGHREGDAFARRVKAAMDPAGKFVEA
jgi:hypothetical protein